MYKLCPDIELWKGGEDQVAERMEDALCHARSTIRNKLSEKYPFHVYSDLNGMSFPVTRTLKPYVLNELLGPMFKDAIMIGRLF